MTEQEALRRHLSKLGKKGGPIGGKARMAMLTPKQRKELAKRAAAARWGNAKARAKRAAKGE
jgi:hypothetical protein